MKTLPLLLALLLLPLTPIFAQSENKEMPSTSHAAFDSMLQSLLSHSVPELSVVNSPSEEQAVFLDARAKTEYEVSHIPGAKWVGFAAFQKKEVKKLPKDAPIVVYCSVGYRSEKITEKLQGMGFTNVSNLYGGIFAWKNQGREVIDAEGKPTEKVHTYNEDWGQWLFKGEKVH